MFLSLGHLSSKAYKLKFIRFAKIFWLYMDVVLQEEEF